jgi:hypothetical protein
MLDSFSPRGSVRSYYFAALRCTCALQLAALSIASAQTLPLPSRTVFRCDVAGKVVYSDSPCLGARKVDVEPTRGADKSTGKERVGSDVRREQQREGLANAVKPITGMNAKQFDVATNRTKLTAEAHDAALSNQRGPQRQRRPARASCCTA